jgi:hypothetical protein
MIKYDLRQQNYKLKDKENNDSLVTLIWVVLTGLIIFGTFNGITAAVKNFPDLVNGDPLAVLNEYFGGFAFIIIMFGPMILYMILKFIMTVIFCHASPASSIKLKLLENNGMPVCLCREAFKTWQTVLIYCAPVFIIYLLMFWLCVASSPGNGIYMTIFFFTIFFMCYDLTLVLYVLFYKIKDRMDYIAIDHHVYMLTLYHKSYYKEIEDEDINKI